LDREIGRGELAKTESSDIPKELNDEALSLEVVRSNERVGNLLGDGEGVVSRWKILSRGAAGIFDFSEVLRNFELSGVEGPTRDSG